MSVFNMEENRDWKFSPEQEISNTRPTKSVHTTRVTLKIENFEN
jgi:hypothetical protein